MPFPQLGMIGGPIFNYGDSAGSGPIYQNPYTGSPEEKAFYGGGKSFGGLWVVMIILAAVGLLIFFMMR